MAWDFETDPEYQKLLDWADEFVREECEPLDLAFPHLQFVPLDDNRRKVIDPLKEEVRRNGPTEVHKTTVARHEVDAVNHPGNDGASCGIMDNIRLPSKGRRSHQMNRQPLHPLIPSLDTA